MHLSRTTMLSVWLLLLPWRVQALESCGTCHPDVRTEYADSVHANDFGCTACHGGDAAAVSLDAHAAGKGYIGKPDRKDVPRLCAACHADPAQMKPFNLPTDQYAQYQTSGHGLHLAQGDTRVAVCTDCHGTHGIRSVREPTSPVNRRNIPTTCGRCHADQALMAQYNLPADQLEKFCGSVHGYALYVDEHPSAPTCATCHGAHGATAAQVGATRTVCGNCHARTREYFNEGPHHNGLLSECVNCHGDHAVSHPDHTLFDTACQRCHAPDSSAVATGQKLKTLLSRAQESLDAATTEMAEAGALFPTVTRFRPRLVQARAHLLEALTVQHSLALERVEDLTRSTRSIADDVRASVHGVQQESRLRYVILGLAWVFILFTAAVAYLYKREYQRARQARARTTEQR